MDTKETELELTKLNQIPEVTITVSTDDEGNYTVRAGLVIVSTFTLEKLLIRYSVVPPSLISVISRTIHEELLHHMFSILETQESIDLERTKSIARREGYIELLSRQGVGS